MRKAPILTILLIALITLAACGGDDDAEPTAVSVTSTPTEEAAQQPTESPATETPQSTAVDPAASGTSSESGILMPEIRTGDIPIDGRFLGDPNAPVTLTEYGDFM